MRRGQLTFRPTIRRTDVLVRTTVDTERRAGLSAIAELLVILRADQPHFSGVRDLGNQGNQRIKIIQGKSFEIYTIKGNELKIFLWSFFVFLEIIAELGLISIYLILFLLYCASRLF